MTPALFQYPGVATRYMRAPNRFRKLLIDRERPKNERDEFGLDFSMADKNAACIEMQRADFPEVAGVPIGFQATLDNDIAIAWE